MSEQKKLLVLGGSPFQIPVIEKAKELGLYVITCDFLPGNPGHALADEYHNISTTDKIAVLNLAKLIGIDAITTFSSDPAVPTVAYVSEELGLPGPSVSSVERLTDKGCFRQLMQQCKLEVPNSFVTDSERLPDGIDPKQRYVVKPVDSSGSKGVTQSYGTLKKLRRAVSIALRFSRSGRCIIESYIEGKQVHGDAFVQEGKVVYYYLGDHYLFTATNSFIPTSTRWPSSISSQIMQAIIDQTEKLVQAAGYLNGPINIEARVDSSDRVYIIEVGPRNGGNFVPIIQERLSGFDFCSAVINLALGYEFEAPSQREYAVGAHYIIHTGEKSFFGGVGFSADLIRHVFFYKIFKSPGDKVKAYTGSQNTLGVCLMEFPSVSERDSFFDGLTLKGINVF